MLKLFVSFLVGNALTLYYSVKILLGLLVYAIRHPFSNGSPKLRVLRPPVLNDPKYGKHNNHKINGVKIHYVESGDSSKPLLVFMHGYPEFWYSWRHQILHFNKNYWCVAMDMRGYGDSEKPEQQSAYKITNMADDLRDLVRQLGRDKFILVAHDWGGLVGWHYRELYPETLTAYVSLSSSTQRAFSTLIHQDSEQFRKSWYVFLNRAWWVPELMMSSGDLRALEKMFRDGGNTNVTDEDIECYKYNFGKPGAFTPPINYYRENFSYLPASSPPAPPQSATPAPAPPCLFAHAERDAYLVPAHAQLVRAQYPHVEAATLEGCGHFCQQEDPERVNALIEQFLRKHNL